jgi:hypothetical protein
MVAPATTLIGCVSFTVPALAVIVAACAGVDAVVVTLKVTFELVQPTVTDAGAVMPVTVLPPRCGCLADCKLIAILKPAVPAGCEIPAVQADAEPAPKEVGVQVNELSACPQASAGNSRATKAFIISPLSPM